MYVQSNNAGAKKGICAFGLFGDPRLGKIILKFES